MPVTSGFNLQRWWPLLVLIVLLWVVWLLKPILAPFLIAAVLGYLGDPVLDWLELKGLSRTLAVTVVFLLISILSVVGFIVIIPLLETQLSKLMLRLPEILNALERTVIPWLNARMGVDVAISSPDVWREIVLKNIGAGGFAAKLFQSISTGSGVVAALVMNALLVPVVTFYILRDWDVLIAKIRDLLPRKQEPLVTKIAVEVDEVLSAFVRGQLIVMLVLGLLYATGLWICDIEFALIIGLIAGIVSFVPYLGVIVGLGLALGAATFQGAEWLQFGGILLVFGIGQTLEGMILTPLLVGERIGLHPVAVIFAVLAGGQLFGFVGVLLGLPVAAVIAVVLRHTHEFYLAGELYNDQHESSL